MIFCIDNFFILASCISVVYLIKKSGQLDICFSKNRCVTNVYQKINGNAAKTQKINKNTGNLRIAGATGCAKN